MLTLQLSNFIIFNLLQTHMPYAIFLHCWTTTEHQNTHYLQELAANNFIFTQFFDIRNLNETENFEYELLRHQNTPTLAIYADMSCENTKYLLKMCSQKRLYNEKYHWLIYDEIGNITHFEQQFEYANLSVNADLTYIQALKNNESQLMEEEEIYIQYDVFNNGNHIGGKLNITIDCEIHCNRTDCKLYQYLSALHLRSKYGNRDRLHDIDLRVAAVVTRFPITLSEKEIIEYLETIDEPQIDVISRYGFKLMMVLRDQLMCNFTYTFYKTWSVTDHTGGIVGSIIDEITDITTSPLLITPGRRPFLSALIETGAFYQVCIFRTPHSGNIRGDAFIEPFSGTVWTMFACMLFIAAVLLWCTFTIEAKHLRRPSDFLPSLLTTLLISYGTACIQGAFIVPRSTGGRFVFIALMLSSFMMYNYYTSVVVSSLLGSPEKSNIKTLTQLADSALEVGLEAQAYTKAYINYSKLPELLRFKARKVTGRDPNKIWLPTEVGVLRVRDDPGFVYVFEGTSGFSVVKKYYKPEEICDLNQVMLRPEKTSYTMLHQNSTYKEIVRLKTMRLLETGVHRKHRSYWIDTKLNCYASNAVITVGIEYVAPLFVMLSGAYIFVLLVLLLEITWKRYEQQVMAWIASIYLHI